MNKFKYLLTYGIKKRLATKAFLISNIVIFIALMGIMNLPNIIAFFDSNETTSIKVSVYDETNKSIETIDLLNEYGVSFSSMLPNTTITFEAIDTIDPENITFNGKDAIVWLSMEDDNLKASIYKDDLEVIQENIIIQILGQYRINVWSIDKTVEEQALIEDFLAPLNYQVITQQKDNSTRDLILSVISMFIAIPIFIMLIMSVQFVGIDIIEEKSTKAIEYVMSTVPPQTHFMTKILAAFAFLVTQSLLILIYGLIGGLISTQILGASGSGANVTEIIGQFTETDAQIIKDVLEALPMALVWTLLFTVVGGLFFMIFMATLASMSTSMEDFQSFQSPFMMVMMIGFYAAIFSVYLGDSIVLKVIGYIPLFAPIVAPTLYMSGVFSIVDTLIAFVLLLASTVGVYYFLTPIYKASILSYDESSFFKRIKKMFKRSKEA
ncbi:MAG: ABC transporter permease [Acholeplasma sp.]|nr:ABC transporter permease [Acholeplasma sp.]